MNKNRISRFFSFYRPYKGLFAADMACSLFVAAVSLTLPLITRHIVNDVLSDADPTNIAGRTLTMGGIMLALICAQSAAAHFYDHMGHVMGARMERDMRNQLFARLQRLPLSFFDGRGVGELMSRVTNDLLTLAELYHHGPEDLVIYLLTFIGALIILFGINAQLALAICLLLPLMALYTLIFSKKLKKAYADSRKSIAGVNALVEDSLSGIRASKSYANEGLEIEKFRAANERFLSSRAAIYRNEAHYFTVFSRFFAQLLPIVIIVTGGILLSGARLGAADLIAFLMYAGYLTSPIESFSRVIGQYQDGFAGFDRFMEIMDAPTEVSGDKTPPISGHVEFRDVCFGYDGRAHVLDGINLTIQRGMRVALVGGSGAGKTTLCALIPRFYDVMSGEILLDGHDVRDMRLDHLRANVGVVAQDAYLFAGSVLDNILYGKPGAGLDEAMAASKKAGAHDFIMGLPEGYNTDIGPRGARLSGGQRQRISIARAFIKDPPVLIFDEATSQLDSVSERVVLDSLNALSQGRTTIIIAHRLSTVRQADSILVLGDGGIAEQGTHDELMSAGGIYAKLYKTL